MNTDIQFKSKWSIVLQNYLDELLLYFLHNSLNGLTELQGRSDSSFADEKKKNSPKHDLVQKSTFS